MVRADEALCPLFTVLVLKDYFRLIASSSEVIPYSFVGENLSGTSLLSPGSRPSWLDKHQYTGRYVRATIGIIIHTQVVNQSRNSLTLDE